MWEEKKIPSSIDMSEEEYRALNYCSYSFLSKLSRSGYKAFSSEVRVGKAMNLGSFIDCYILTPELLDEKFARTLTAPTASKKILADFVIENNDTVPSKENLYELTLELGLWGRWSKEKVLATLDDSFMEYLNQAISSKGKIPYTLEDLKLAIACKNSLADSHLTEHIFRPEGLEILFQVKGIFEFDELHIKFMVDIIVVDTKEKIIYIYDLKTGEENLDNFENSFIKYRYDIQYYLYTKGVEEVKESLGYKDFEVKPLEFIYLSKKEPDIPVIYKVPEHIDIYNGYTTKLGYQITGIKKLIDDFKFYSGGFKVPRRVAEGKGIVVLDI